MREREEFEKAVKKERERERERTVATRLREQ
jgi:hypothetical protein